MDCYLCGALKGDPMIPACGVTRCPMKEHAAQRGKSPDYSGNPAPSVAAPINAAPGELPAVTSARRAMKAGESGYRPDEQSSNAGDEPAGRRSTTSSLRRDSAQYPPAAAPTPEEIAFNEIGLDEDPWYAKARYEHLRGERRR